MNALFSKNTTKQRVLLVDVGGMSIGASLVDLSSDDVPVILFQVRKRIPITQVKHPGMISSAAISILDEVLGEAHDIHHKGGGGAIEGVHVFLGAPWCHPSISIKNQDFGAPKKITNMMVHEALTQHRKTREKGHPDMHIIETEPLDVRLDGYKVQDHFTKKAKNFSVDIFSTAAPAKTTGHVERIIGQYFAVERLYYHSSTLALYSVLRGIFSGGEQYLIIDISGDMTEVSLVENNTLVEIGSVPVGAYDLARTIGEIYKTTPEEALSRLNILREGRGVKKDTRMNVTLLKAEDKWKDAVVNLIKTFDYTSRIPNHAFYTTAVGVHLIFEEILEKNDLFKFGDAFYIGSESLDPFVAYQTSRTNDPTLALQAVYAHMYIHSS
ncbi:MAG: hypothetical protein WDZ70_00805 [Candidatus Paceibacterota bacterium]